MTASKTVKTPTLVQAKSGDTVTVACKLPNGLLLRVYKFETRSEAVLGGGTRDVKVAVQNGAPVHLRGHAVPFGMQAHDLSGGYALTRGIDASFWNTWLEQNAEFDMVKNGLVFAHASAEHAAEQAIEQEDVRTGLEPLMTDGDPRVARSSNGPKITEEETRAKARKAA